MMKNLALLIGIFCLADQTSGQQIREVEYLDRSHFKIDTKSAVYMYDQKGGGFSSILDKEGIEWVGYQPGEGEVPASAAADFRGLPNLVFRGEDNGAGHPGFDQCFSMKIDSNKIRTESISGKWSWEWTFDNEGVLLEVITIDTTRNYWFLYEGTPGGSFEPQEKYWGNNLDGIRNDTPVLRTNSIARGKWDWAFFGDQRMEKSLVIVHLTPDEHEDNFSYMGSSNAGIKAEEGMVVFGFGRSGSTPLMNEQNRFYLTFLESNYDIRSAVQQIIKKFKSE